MSETSMEQVMRAIENAVLNPHVHGCSVSIVGDPQQFYRALAQAALSVMTVVTK